MTTHLVVPGLLGHLPRLGEIGELPRFPNLERLLTRGDQRSAAVGYSETLFDLFGVACVPEQDLPTAAICYQAESGVEPLGDACVFHADPIHLRPDQDRLLAFDFHAQPLTLDEAGEFSAAFNQHFAEDGLKLLTPHPLRWYLVVEQCPALNTRSLDAVLGRNIDLFLPQGDDARRWRGWMNELQMLFHSLPINAVRQNQGQLPVSGLWFSGGGLLPRESTQGFARIEGECQLPLGLQTLANAQDDRQLLLDHAPGRAVFDANVEDWLKAVQAVDARLGGLMTQSLVLHPCEGRAWQWQPNHRYRFWRRSKQLSSWLSEEAPL